MLIHDQYSYIGIREVMTPAHSPRNLSIYREVEALI